MSETDTRPSPRAQRQPRRASGRFFVRAAVCVVLGVLLSFASALPVLWVRNVPGDYRSPVASGQRFGVRIWMVPAIPDRLEQYLTSPAPWWAHVDPDKNVSFTAHDEVASGFPLPVLSGGHSLRFTPDEDRPFVESRWGKQLSIRESMIVRFNEPNELSDLGIGFQAILPTRIIWRGLIGNTIFYSLIVWGVFALLGWYQRARRRRRNKCEGCAYSLKGLEDAPRCPECGRGIRRDVPSPRRGEDVATEL